MSSHSLLAKAKRQDCNHGHTHTHDQVALPRAINPLTALEYRSIALSHFKRHTCTPYVGQIEQQLFEAPSSPTLLGFLAVWVGGGFIVVTSSPTKQDSCHVGSWRQVSRTLSTLASSLGDSNVIPHLPSIRLQLLLQAVNCFGIPHHDCPLGLSPPSLLPALPLGTLPQSFGVSSFGLGISFIY